MIEKIWYQPTFSSILEKRTENMALLGVGVLQVGLHLAGLPGWACPFKQLTGIPCPGCGLTTATGQLFHGNFLASIQTHAFAPIFLVAFMIMALAIILPKIYSENLVTWLSRLESKTGFTAWILTLLMFYWFVRLWGLV